MTSTSSRFPKGAAWIGGGLLCFAALVLYVRWIWQGAVEGDPVVMAWMGFFEPVSDLIHTVTAHKQILAELAQDPALGGLATAQLHLDTIAICLGLALSVVVLIWSKSLLRSIKESRPAIDDRIKSINRWFGFSLYGCVAIFVFITLIWLYGMDFRSSEDWIYIFMFIFISYFFIFIVWTIFRVARWFIIKGLHKDDSSRPTFGAQHVNPWRMIISFSALIAIFVFLFFRIWVDGGYIVVSDKYNPEKLVDLGIIIKVIFSMFMSGVNIPLILTYAIFLLKGVLLLRERYAKRGI